ncbi:MAG: hypothetical protein B0D92_00015, partial [Spirochaeta sp. LUC14_002_19_P3]
MAKIPNKADKEVMKSIHITALLLLIPLWLHAADIVFSPNDLSTDNQLLFTCTAEQPGWSRFKTAMIADLDDLNDKDNEAISALSYFPELVNYYPDTKELEILNRFGLFRSSFDKNYRFRQLGLYTSYKQGFSIPNGRTLPAIGSPDGQWLLLQETNSSIRGNLYLINSKTGKKHLITSNHVTSFNPDYALWSEDSRYVIYAHSGKLFYLSVQLIENNNLPNENYREFGTGKISNIKWVDKNTLYYLSGSSVILISPAELPTRSFYLPPLSAGNIVGRIPLDFDPNLDDFRHTPGFQ